MRSRLEGDMILIRMLPGEEIVSSLVDVCREHKVRTALIFSSIGQLRDVELGYFVKKGDYFPEVFNDVYELLSMSGMITEQDGDYIPHMHVVLGNVDKETVGGHLIKGTVQITNETVLIIKDIQVRRKYNESTGLMDLYPS